MLTCLRRISFLCILAITFSEDVEKPTESPYARRKLPLGVTDIREMLEQDYAYVDKTSFALQLIQQERSCYILRPNGFGKTLFLSTLEEIFKGNKELFRNTEIYRSNYSWPKHPVLRIDLSQFDSRKSDIFETAFREYLIDFINSYGVNINKSEENLNEIFCSFENVSLAAGADVIILVDQYDTPISDNIQNPTNVAALNVAEDMRQLIAFFLKFVTRKSYNPKVKFAFVFGLNKYEWIGGAPNHILNIEMNPDYATLLGFTDAEVKTYFRNHIRHIARKRSGRTNVTEEEVLEEMHTWYGGYRFSEKEVTVLNPESTLRYLNSRKAENYWYASRNISALVDDAARDNMPLGLYETTVGLRLKPDEFNISYLRMVDVRAIMYHAGYLTIRKCHPEKKWYDLDFPNKEVRDAYNNTYLRRDRTKDHHKVKNN